MKTICVTRLFGLLCVLTTMTDISSDRFNSDNCIKNIFKMCNQNLEELPYWETIQDKAYKDYYVDFVIRSNKDIQFTGYLWGYYENYGLELAIPFIDNNPDKKDDSDLFIKAGEANNVMAFAGMFLQYTFIVNEVKSFDCGIMVSDETKEANSGLEITLELWMYEKLDEHNAYAGKSFLIGVPYTFKIS